MAYESPIVSEPPVQSERETGTGSPFSGHSGSAQDTLFSVPGKGSGRKSPTRFIVAVFAMVVVIFVAVLLVIFMAFASMEGMVNSMTDQIAKAVAK